MWMSSVRTTNLIVLANRAPFRHERAPDGTTRIVRSASGVVTAIEPLMQSHAGTWVAHGAPIDTESTARLGRLSPRPRYRLRYVHCPPQEYEGFYSGFANGALWPLCHATSVQPTFMPDEFRNYRSANRRFAAAVADEGKSGTPIVLVQDYHFALAPEMIRSGLPGSTIATFWHIPWPNADVFARCPWHRQLLDGLLASDVIGFQTVKDGANFLAAAMTVPGCAVDPVRGHVRYRGSSVLVRAYPVGIEWNSPVLRELPDAAACRAQTLTQLSLPCDVRLGVGVDRLDYTKGIANKFRAIEAMLAANPELRGRFCFVQVAEPSREALPAYRQVRADTFAEFDRVNALFGTDRYQPIVLLERHLDAHAVYRMYRAADVCFVNSLDDGMNLVAKEFVAARDDEQGVLVLSRMAGASRQLTAALIVDPSAIGPSAEALTRALAMSPGEQRTRMRAMRTVVSATSSRWWADQLIRDARRQRGGGSTGQATSVLTRM
jgi:trehalose 6-phosphate synthase